MALRGAVAVKHALPPDRPGRQRGSSLSFVQYLDHVELNEPTEHEMEVQETQEVRAAPEHAAQECAGPTEAANAPVVPQDAP